MRGDILEDLKGFIHDGIEANLGMDPESTSIALNNADAVVDQLLHDYGDDRGLDDEDYHRAIGRSVREQAILDGY